VSFKEEAIAELRIILPPGSTVYTEIASSETQSRRETHIKLYARQNSLSWRSFLPRCFPMGLNASAKGALPTNTPEATPTMPRTCTKTEVMRFEHMA
jgi:hypothetical protein